MAIFRTFFHGSLTGYEITCLKSFVDHGHRVVVYSYGHAEIPDEFESGDAASIIPENELFFYADGPAKGSVAAFANRFRYALCAAFGDWWIDTDVVCLSADWPEGPYSIIAGWQYTGAINNAVLKLDPALASELQERARQLGKDVEFLGSGPTLVTRLVKEEGKEGLILPPTAFYAVPYEHWNWLHSSHYREVACELTKNALAVHLWNDFSRRQDFDKTVLPAKDSFFGQIVAKHGTSRYFRAPLESEAANPGDGYDDYPRKSRGDQKLPLLSFIVVNHNYGRFLSTCVESIMTQTYSAIECVVVDNGSTDESGGILDDFFKRYPSLKIVRNAANEGQSAACCAGLALTKGQYVAFVDADDYLLPNYAAIHIRAHLTLPGSVGFTSGDMLQMVDDKIVVGHYFKSVGFWRYAKAPLTGPQVLDDILPISAVLASDELNADELAADVWLVAKATTDWLWAATSATVYRRDALLLFANNPLLTSLKTATDTYFDYAINSLMGSALINKPVAVYRIHGQNNFTHRATLNGLNAFKREADIGRQAALFALRHMITEFDFFAAQTRNVVVLWSAMKALEKKAGSDKWQWGDRVLRFVLKMYFGRIARNIDTKFTKSAALSAGKRGGSAPRPPQ
jgi:glycosyltransferase involved in cell wall biosynthesis